MNKFGTYELTTLCAPPEEFSGLSPTYPYDMWGYGLLFCWIDGGVIKSHRVTMSNFSALSYDVKLQEMTSGWVESIENKIFKECPQICTHAKPEERRTLQASCR